MSNVKDGGQAFPAISLSEGLQVWYGMTLRDYFAAKALPAIYKDYCEYAHLNGWPENWRIGVAKDAYSVADAMLAARESSQ